jgi:hypothetical protein
VGIDAKNGRIQAKVGPAFKEETNDLLITLEIIGNLRSTDRERSERKIFLSTDLKTKKFCKIQGHSKKYGFFKTRTGGREIGRKYGRNPEKTGEWTA